MLTVKYANTCSMLPSSQPSRGDSYSLLKFSFMKEVSRAQETLYSLAKASTPGLTWIGKASTVSNLAQ